MAGFPTLKGSWPWPWIWSYCIPSCITYRPLFTRQISLKSKKQFVDGRTDGRTDIRDRSLLGVDSKLSRPNKETGEPAKPSWPGRWVWKCEGVGKRTDVNWLRGPSKTRVSSGMCSCEVRARWLQMARISRATDTSTSRLHAIHDARNCTACDKHRDTSEIHRDNKTENNVVNLYDTRNIFDISYKRIQCTSLVDCCLAISQVSTCGGQSGVWHRHHHHLIKDNSQGQGHKVREVNKLRD